MQIVVLAAFIITFVLLEALSPHSAEPWLNVQPSASLIVPGLCGYWLVAAAASMLAVRLALRPLSRSGEIPAPATRHYHSLMLLVRGWLVVAMGGVMLLGWGRWLMDGLHLSSVPLVGKAAAVAPFVVALLIVWAAQYPFHRAVRKCIAAHQNGADAATYPPCTLGEYLGYNVRHHLLFIAVPVGLIMLGADLLSLAEPTVTAYLPSIGGSLLLAAHAAIAVGVVLLAPAIIVRIWRTRRLPAGPLREELGQMCRRLGLKVRELRIWQTGGMTANAAVMGMIGPVRYVLLTDALIEQMPPQQIQAVFAHEAGHIVSHHIFYSVLFAISAAFLAACAGESLAMALDWDPWTAEVFMAGLLVVAWGLGFGWLSRRFERHSDIQAAWAMDRCADGRITPAGAATFASALQTVAKLNGIPLRQRNWRHGSIAARVRYVLHLGSTGGTRRPIDCLIKRIKIILWITSATAAGLCAALALVPWE